MDQKSFSEAYEKALQIVSTVEDREYGLAAFPVVLAKLWGATSGLETTTRPVGTGLLGSSGGEPKPRSLTKQRILDLREEEFFGDPRSVGEVQGKLGARGFHHNSNDVGMALVRLAQKKQLRRLSLGRGYKYVAT